MGISPHAVSERLHIVYFHTLQQIKAPLQTLATISGNQNSRHRQQGLP